MLVKSHIFNFTFSEIHVAIFELLKLDRRTLERQSAHFFFLLSSENVSKPYTMDKVQDINLLKPTGHVMHQQFNIQQLYALPTLYLFVLYLSENKQRLVPLTA